MQGVYAELWQRLARAQGCGGFNRFAHSAEPTYWVVGGWVVLSVLFVFIGWVVLFVFFVFYAFQFGSSGHPLIQPKEQLFN